ncbi:hypothetical protein F4779DRAFT_620963 [Xylariaceae sp. FL0662B]|nr:hypothetical protein F4779DRAFT_620963 [Xylariaceae sp. FL0662B]
MGIYHDVSTRTINVSPFVHLAPHCSEQNTINTPLFVHPTLNAVNRMKADLTYNITANAESIEPTRLQLYQSQHRSPSTKTESTVAHFCRRLRRTPTWKNWLLACLCLCNIWHAVNERNVSSTLRNVSTALRNAVDRVTSLDKRNRQVKAPPEITGQYLFYCEKLDAQGNPCMPRGMQLTPNVASHERLHRPMSTYIRRQEPFADGAACS